MIGHFLLKCTLGVIVNILFLLFLGFFMYTGLRSLTLSLMLSDSCYLSYVLMIEPEEFQVYASIVRAPSTISIQIGLLFQETLNASNSVSLFTAVCKCTNLQNYSQELQSNTSSSRLIFDLR